MSDITLIIAEKPSVAQSVAAWLSKTKSLPLRKASGYIEVGPYRVSWLFGHLLENIEPHEYNASYKAWSLSQLPIVPPVWKLRPRVDKKTKKTDTGTLAQIEVLKKLLSTSTRVIGLGDPDQEGQLLQDEFLRWVGCRLPTDRLWLSATDDATIAKAWAEIKPNTDYEGYYWSALARSHADWLVGINGTRAYTCASQANGGNATLTTGRVQTPTLWLVVEREAQIQNFKPVNFYTPYIALATKPEFKANWAPDKEKDSRLDPEGRLVDKTAADAIASACKKAGHALVANVKSSKGKENPPLPFSLSSLQEYVSKKYNIGVQDTLALAQKLYEKQIASYPRTDCDYIPESQHDEAPVILASIAACADESSKLGAVLGGAPVAANPTLKSRAFDNKKVSAHHAILPRPCTPAQLAGLSSQELLIWTEIAKRYLLQFFPSAEFLSTEIELVCADEPFSVSGKVFTLRGWKDAFVTSDSDSDADADEAGTTLPVVKKGDSLPLRDANYESSRTKPPKRFTEGTLIAAMKGIHKYVTDPKMKSVLRENVGIGTVATQANTISELFGRGFIVLDSNKKDIKPTPIGIQLINALPNAIKQPDMTALWQQAMNDIRKTGQAGYDSFMAAQVKWIQELIKEAPALFSGKSFVVAGKKKSGGLQMEPSAHKCVACGSSLNRIKGKFGWFFGCSNETCKAIYKDVEGKPVAKTAAPAGPVTVDGVTSGSACPACKKGTLQARVCGPQSKTPGKTFLSCSNYFATGKAKCSHSVWPK